MAKIDQKYFGDSILYNFMLNKIIERDKIEDFRGNYLKGLSNNDLDQSLNAVNDFKNNLEFFINEDFRFIDTRPFVEILEYLEKYYSDMMPDEFNSFRWYQYSCLFFSFVFFSLQHNQEFKNHYLNYLNNEVIIDKGMGMINPDSEIGFNRLGYWMATGCGKTLIMYSIVYMYCKLFATDIKTLYVIVPTDELRRQHKLFLSKFAENHYGSISDKGTIIDFERIPMFGDLYLSGQLSTIPGFRGAELSNDSVLLMDEAHKGASNDAGSIESLKNSFIAKSNTMLFEFSATFQDAFKNEKIINLGENIFDYYHFSSIYKYNLFDFNSDGFGKDYIVNQVKKTSEKDVEDKRDLVCNALANFALQLQGYKTLKRRTEGENALWIEKDSYLEGQYGSQKGLRIYKPLFLGLSWKLDDNGKDGEGSETTLTKILEHFSYIFSNLEEYRNKIQEQQIQLEDFYQLLTGLEYKKGDKLGFQIWYDKQNDEIKLRLGKTIMLINTGKNAAIAEKLKTIVEGFSFQDLGIASQRQFNNVDKNGDILFLFGSRKFIEGWDSKRPSSILLFKMGSSGTVLATQILGRGLRLYGIKGDGYRHLNYSTKSLRDSKLEHLEQICMFGYDIDEFEKFIEDLAGNGYRVAVIKKREFSDSFKKYLSENNINETDDHAVESVFKKYFKLLDETLDGGEETEISAENLEVEIIKGKLRFIYCDNDKNIKKTMGSLNAEYVDLAEFKAKGLVKGGIIGGSKITIDYFNKSYNEVFGKENVFFIVNKLLSEEKGYTINENDIKTVSEFVGNIVIRTDKLSKDTDKKEHMFNLNQQKKIIDYFIENLKREFNSVSNRIKNYKFKGINTELSYLKKNNLIDEIKLEFAINKNEEDSKGMIKLFFKDSTKFSIEEDYENLDEGQKAIVKDLFRQKNEDFHIYDRLYHFSNKGDLILHDIKDKDDRINNPKFTPTDLNINGNEEDKIYNMLNRIKNNKLIAEKYSIFYLRNLVGPQGIKLKYENVDGEYSSFYPDFLVWFINKNDDQDITVIYLEPKGEGVDKNREKKIERLKDITSMDVDQEIKDLFSVPTDEIGNKKYQGLKVLGVMQFQKY